MPSFVYQTMHPEMYHGFGKKAPFFEGWYFKLVSAAEGDRYGIIPGVILGEDEHAFIQVLDGPTGHSTYHRFPLADFNPSTTEFDVCIGPNRFNKKEIRLDIQSPQRSIQGELHFPDLQPWPVTLLSPGIMGWYAWVPAMECYHGVISLDHGIEGMLEIDNQRIDFSGGRGYIEKDWGKSFPSAWIWFQSNHFDQPGVCITASTAIIPWMGTSFRGFIAGLWLNGELYRFTTYTGAKVVKLALTDERVEWVLTKGAYRLDLTAFRAEGGLLRGPSRKDMGVRVDETLRAVVDVRLIDPQGESVFEGRGRHAGLEVNGDLLRLLKMK